MINKRYVPLFFFVFSICTPDFFDNLSEHALEKNMAFCMPSHPDPSGTRSMIGGQTGPQNPNGPEFKLSLEGISDTSIDAFFQRASSRPQIDLGNLEFGKNYYQYFLLMRVCNRSQEPIGIDVSAPLDSNGNTGFTVKEFLEALPSMLETIKELIKTYSDSEHDPKDAMSLTFQDIIEHEIPIGSSKIVLLAHPGSVYLSVFEPDRKLVSKADIDLTIESAKALGFDKISCQLFPDGPDAHKHRHNGLFYWSPFYPKNPPSWRVCLQYGDFELESYIDSNISNPEFLGANKGEVFFNYQRDIAEMTKNGKTISQLKHRDWNQMEDLEPSAFRKFKPQDVLKLFSQSAAKTKEWLADIPAIGEDTALEPCEEYINEKPSVIQLSGDFEDFEVHIHPNARQFLKKTVRERFFAAKRNPWVDEARIQKVLDKFPQDMIICFNTSELNNYDVLNSPIDDRCIFHEHPPAFVSFNTDTTETWMYFSPIAPVAEIRHLGDFLQTYGNDSVFVRMLWTDLHMANYHYIRTCPRVHPFLYHSYIKDAHKHTVGVCFAERPEVNTSTLTMLDLVSMIPEIMTIIREDVYLEEHWAGVEVDNRYGTVSITLSNGVRLNCHLKRANL